MAELDTLTAEHPLRERLRCQQMLALYRAGRQSDALAVYHATRQTLVGELRIEPSAAVRELHDAILRQDRALDVPASAAPARQRMTSRRSAAAAYPDRAAPDGTHLVPEVAAAMPTVSADGRTYTFTVRPGFRFSSGAPVTARSFRRALDRFLSPRMPNGLHSLFADVVGFRAYESGRSTRLAGVTATARTLTIRLVRPSPR